MRRGVAHIMSRLGYHSGLGGDASPAASSPKRRPGIFAARVSNCRRVLEVCDNLLVGAPRFGGERNLPRAQAEGVTDPLKVSRSHR